MADRRLDINGSYTEDKFFSCYFEYRYCAKSSSILHLVEYRLAVEKVHQIISHCIWADTEVFGGMPTFLGCCVQVFES